MALPPVITDNLSTLIPMSSSELFDNTEDAPFKIAIGIFCLLAISFTSIRYCLLRERRVVRVEPASTSTTPSPQELQKVSIVREIAIPNPKKNEQPIVPRLNLSPESLRVKKEIETETVEETAARQVHSKKNIRKKVGQNGIAHSQKAAKSPPAKKQGAPGSEGVKGIGQKKTRTRKKRAKDTSKWEFVDYGRNGTDQRTRKNVEKIHEKKTSNYPALVVEQNEMDVITPTMPRSLVIADLNKKYRFLTFILYSKKLRSWPKHYGNCSEFFEDYFKTTKELLVQLGESKIVSEVIANINRLYDQLEFPTLHPAPHEHKQDPWNEMDRTLNKLNIPWKQLHELSTKMIKIKGIRGNKPRRGNFS